MNQQKIQKVLSTIGALLTTSATTTTLDVKNALRKSDPKDKWYQDDIHDIMEDLATQGQLTYTDQGTYRIYSKVPVATPTNTQTTSSLKKLSRTQVVQAIRDSGYKFITVTFVKTDNTTRVMNCQVSKNDFMDNLGYIKAHTKDGLKRVNPKTIQTVKIKGEVLQVK